MPEVQELTIEECEALRIKFGGRKMKNGECRFRCMGSDGSGYIRTVMPIDAPGAWQNSHYHGGPKAGPNAGVIEAIIVQAGWIAAANLHEGKIWTIRVHRRNSLWVSQPGVPHNVYMPPGSITHCVKYGNDVVNPEKNSDWWPAPTDFDNWTKSLDQAAIFKLAGLTASEILELVP